MNKIYQGDCLDIMKSMDDESIDLIATDPPFDKGRIFKGKDFEFSDIYDNFLEYMIPRIKEMYRLLKPTGSLYWHCDPSISHYLKIELDKIFGIKQFRNEIVWCYNGGGVPKRDFPRKHDVIFRYQKSDDFIFNVERREYGKHNTTGKRATDNGGTRSIDYNPKGTPISDHWSDISPIINWHAERCGYPTQKPVALYERIIKASSNSDDVVLDPFCGSGTTLLAARNLGRSYIGIDKNDVRELIMGRMYNKDNYE